MKRIACLTCACLLLAGLSSATNFGSLAAAKDSQTFVGTIGDSMCGAKHMMPGESDKQCTVECIKGGAKYILIGQGGKVYNLTDQKKPAPFAGDKVKVTGTLNGDTIAVESIAPAT